MGHPDGPPSRRYNPPSPSSSSSHGKSPPSPPDAIPQTTCTPPSPIPPQALIISPLRPPCPPPPLSRPWTFCVCYQADVLLMLLRRPLRVECSRGAFGLLLHAHSAVGCDDVCVQSGFEGSGTFVLLHIQPGRLMLCSMVTLTARCMQVHPPYVCLTSVLTCLIWP